MSLTAEADAAVSNFDAALSHSGKSAVESSRLQPRPGTYVGSGSNALPNVRLSQASFVTASPPRSDVCRLSIGSVSAEEPARTGTNSIPEPSNVEEGRLSADVMVVESIAMGLKTPNTIEQVYGSSFDHAQNSKFHPIVFNSGLFEGFPDRETILRTYVVPKASSNHKYRSPPQCIIPEASCRKLRVALNRSEEVKRFVHSFMRKHAGVAVVLMCIGARPKSTKLKNHYVKGNSVLIRMPPGNCVLNALANAVGSLAGKTAAEYIASSRKRRHINLKQLGAILQEAPAEVRNICIIRKAPKELIGCMKCGDRKAPFKWLARQKTGYFVVHLKVSGKIDHAVAIDGEKRLILDPEEPCPVRLTENNIILCGGDNTEDSVRVEAVREVSYRP